MNNANCEYVKEAYGVPACLGREVELNGRLGVISKDMGPHIGVTFDDEEAGTISPYHPLTEGLTYGGFKKIRKLSPGKQRYRDYIDAGEWFNGTFGDWIKCNSQYRKDVRENNFVGSFFDWLYQGKSIWDVA